MRTDSHLEEFGGRPVVEWKPGQAVKDPADTLFRLSIEYDDEGNWQQLLEKFLAQPMAGFAAGIVVGGWQSDDTSAPADPVVEALISARDRLPNMNAIFVGDITQEENEISWIVQADLGPLLMAYPRLEHFGARGGSPIRFSRVSHNSLRTLVVECGGLPVEAVEDIFSASLPALEHLELWLGEDNYGATTTVEDFEPLLSGNRFPRLKYLGLRDSEIADGIAKALAGSAIVSRIETLDLSLGTLGDEGANALAESPAVRRLKKLDLHFHYMSTPVMQRMERLGPVVDVSEQQEADKDADGTEWRYIAVSE
jgi:hypothetical protein